MKNNKVFPFFTLLVIASLSIAACSTQEAPEQPAPPPVEEVMEEPTEQVTENPLNPTALGSCYNPYFPVMEGKVWKYTTVTGDTTSTTDISYKDVTTSSFTSVQQLQDISTEVLWTCGPDGLFSSQFPSMSSIVQMPDLKIETLDVKGVFIPSEDKWQVGYSWNTEYVIKVSFKSGESVIEGQGILTVANTISTIEPITVLSGTYNDAYKVDISGNILLNAMGTEINMPFTNSIWFVKNVGMVKSTSADPAINYKMELVSFE